MSNSLGPYGLQDYRLPCPSLPPRVCSNSCSLGWWYQSTISSSGPQSFPASVFSNESALCIASGGQIIGASASASIFPMNIQGWFPLELTGLISLQSKGLSRLEGTLKSLHQHLNLKASVLQCSAFFVVQLSHPYMTTGKTIALTTWTFLGKVMSLLFNMSSLFVIALLPRSKLVLINSWVLFSLLPDSSRDIWARLCWSPASISSQLWLWVSYFSSLSLEVLIWK